tara:strand:+ start:258 stop:578 length:321 start_codon:yes stop_codon:yes gene_type:complete
MAKKWAKKGTKNSFFNRDIFSVAFSGFLGIMSANLVLGLLSAIFFGLGYYMIINNNKKGTKLLEDLQTEQYIGVGFCFIGLLPWLRYFFAGFLLEAGESLFDQSFE